MLKKNISSQEYQKTRSELQQIRVKCSTPITQRSDLQTIVDEKEYEHENLICKIPSTTMGSRDSSHMIVLSLDLEQVMKENRTLKLAHSQYKQDINNTHSGTNIVFNN